MFRVASTLSKKSASSAVFLFILIGLSVAEVGEDGEDYFDDVFPEYCDENDMKCNQSCYPPCDSSLTYNDCSSVVCTNLMEKRSVELCEDDCLRKIPDETPENSIDKICPKTCPYFARCDMKLDCCDCRDELGCQYANGVEVLQCEDKVGCVFVGDCKSTDQCPRFCDGVPTCKDGSDEPNGEFGLKCMGKPRNMGRALSPKTCTIPPKYIERWRGVSKDAKQNTSFICKDELDDCYDGNYVNVERCFPCLDGTVILKTQLCNGKIDCSDSSDEYLCNDSSEDSVDNSTVDGKQCDKGNGSIICPSATHVTATKCDGRPECPHDYYDECNDDCKLRPDYCDRPILENECLKTQFALCDGVEDCRNGFDEKDCPFLIPCNANSSEKYDICHERCNGRKDCPNLEDEKGCEKTFVCDDESLIFATQVMDKVFDCPRGEDECEPKRGDRTAQGQLMIEHFLLLILWIMAVFALVGNFLVIVVSVRDLRATYLRASTAAVTGRVGACNKTLVLNLAIADFLMGIYLLILGVKALEYNGSYCTKAENWKSGRLCSGIGSLAFLSSQASVLIMFMMTSYRLYSLRYPFQAEKLKVRYLVVAVILLWVIPIFIAVYPLTVSDKNFGFSLTVSLPYFKESYILDKRTFEKFITTAWNFSKTDELPGRDWHSLMETFCVLYPKVCKGGEKNPIVSKWYGYYSADSVCLPRLFPRIGDGGWKFTMGLIIFDFLAFLYILTAYLMMCQFTVTGSYERSGGTSRGASFSSVDELRSREDRVIWKRISRLLITDFLCWIPICIMCFLSLGEIEIPSMLYKISAIILLPINSAVNPLLYSNVVNSALKRFCSKWLHAVPISYASLCKRIGANGTPPGGSRENSGNVESPCDDQQTNGGLISGAETRSITLSDNDRSRMGTRQDSKRLISSKELSVCLKGNNIECELTDEISTEGISDGLPSPNRGKKCLSERHADRLQLNEIGKGITYHRPKSQSTTSTCTTFTTIAQDDC